MAGSDAEWENRRREASMEAERVRLAEALGPPGSITGTASSSDGSVTVEVGMGGALREVRLTHRATRHGPAHLSHTVLAVARQATARANHKARAVYTEVLGEGAARHLDSLGLAYDPALLDDADGVRG